MKIIDKQLCDSLLEQARVNPRLRMNFDLRNSPADSSQRMLNAFHPSTELPIHRHPDTSESIVLIKGRIDEVMYDDSGREIGRVHLNNEQGVYGVDIPAGTWHNAIIYEPSIIITTKDGAYAPLSDKDVLRLC